MRDTDVDAVVLAEFEQFGAQLRVGGEAAAHDQRVGIVLRQPRMALRASTVATESARDAHTSSTGISWPAACSAFHPTGHGGLDTGETEIIRVRGTGLALGQTHRHLDGVRVAVLTMAVDVRAAGYGKPSRRATLSKHSPAASSSVVPTTSILRGMSSTCSSEVWPPETIRASVSLGNGPNCS